MNSQHATAQVFIFSHYDEAARNQRELMRKHVKLLGFNLRHSLRATQ